MGCSGPIYSILQKQNTQVGCGARGIPGSGDSVLRRPVPPTLWGKQPVGEVRTPQHTQLKGHDYSTFLMGLLLTAGKRASRNTQPAPCLLSAPQAWLRRDVPSAVPCAFGKGDVSSPGTPQASPSHAFTSGLVIGGIENVLTAPSCRQGPAPRPVPKAIFA